MNELKDLQTTISAVAERVGPSVVGLGRGWGRGSGFVAAEGKVVIPAYRARGEELGVSFADERLETGELIAADPDFGLAVAAVDTADLAPLDWAPDGAEVSFGTPVLALANPGGRGL